MKQRTFQGLFAWLTSLLTLICFVAGATTIETQANKLASLIDPAKLATLRERGANPRIQKAVAILAEAEANKLDPGAVCTTAIEKVKMKPAAGELTKAALLRNLDIASKLGCLDEAGLADMRRGQSPTIKTGPYTGDELSVDHIVPRAVCPELDNVIANLELMPLKLNMKKNSKVGERQVSHAEKLHTAGLLSREGLEKVKRVAKAFGKREKLGCLEESRALRREPSTLSHLISEKLPILQLWLRLFARTQTPN